LRASDTFDTAQQRFSIEPDDESKVKPFENFEFEVALTAKCEPGEDTERIERSLRDKFKVRIVDYSTGRTFYTDISMAEVTGPLSDFSVFLFSKFLEVDQESQQIAEHDPLLLPNTPEATQNPGITFESVKNRPDALLNNPNLMHGQT